jgi:hypothetical protein
VFSAGLPLLFALLALIAFWLDAARARELASAMAQRLCQHQGVQFLDGSAALESLRLQRSPQGLRLRRVFGFSYYTETSGRQQGSVTLVGARIKAFHLDHNTTLDG